MGRSDSKSKGGGRGGGGKGGKGRGGHHQKGRVAAASSSRHKKVEITFDPTDRREYLTGFSTRKKERRAFGLAMQKVKDRQAKLEERKEQREAQLEKIEDIERNKAALRKGLAGENDDDDDDGDDSDGGDSSDDAGEGCAGRSKGGSKAQHSETFQDERTTHQFGGLVSVTTTFGIPSDDDDDSVKDDDEFFSRRKHGAGHVDEAQVKAGSVTNYIAGVKGTMGTKKRGAAGGGNKHKKGQHGASTMKGMGSGTALKASKKILAKFKAKGGGKGGHGHGDERGGGRGGGKGKKGKGRR